MGERGAKRKRANIFCLNAEIDINDIETGCGWRDQQANGKLLHNA